MSIELLRFLTERNEKKMEELEKRTAVYLATVSAEQEKALRKLREQDEALMAPVSATAPPARDEAGRFEAPAPSSAEQFAANRAAMQAGLRASG